MSKENNPEEHQNDRQQATKDLFELDNTHEQKLEKTDDSIHLETQNNEELALQNIFLEKDNFNQKNIQPNNSSEENFKRTEQPPSHPQGEVNTTSSVYSSDLTNNQETNNKTLDPDNTLHSLQSSVKHVSSQDELLTASLEQQTTEFPSEPSPLVENTAEANNIDVATLPTQNITHDPVAGNIELATLEDQPITFTAEQLLTNSSDVDGDALLVTTVSVDAAFGTITDNGDDTWTFNPTENYNGDNVPVSFTISDGTTTDSATASIDVVAVNDGTVAGNIDLTTAEDTALTFSTADLIANSSDVDGDDLSISAISVDAEFGTITDNGDDTWTFNPAENYNGDDVPVSFTVSDGTTTDTATASIDVAAVNDAPTITISGTTVTEDTAQIIATANDLDGTIDSSALSAEHGTVSIDADGNITYTPDADYNGADTVSLSVTDNEGETSIQTVSLTIDPTQDSPVAIDDSTNNLAQLTDATTSNITVEDSASINLNGSENFALSISVTPDGEQGNYDIIFNKENAVELAFNGHGELQFAMRTEDQSWTWHQTDVSYDVNSINDIQFSYDGENVTISNTNSSGETSTYTQSYTGGIVDDGNDLMIGNRPYGGGRYSMDGNVDNISMTVEGTEVVNLDFDGANRLVDKSGHGNDATLGQGASLEHGGSSLDTTEDTSLVINTSDLLANDTDADGDTLSIASVAATDDTHGTVELVNKVAFEDNFDDGNSGDWAEVSFNGRDIGNWESDSSSVGERSNSAKGIFSHEMGSDAVSTDYSVSVDVNANTGNTYNNGVGIVFSFEDSNNYYQASWDDYSTSYDTNSHHKDFNLIKVENGVKTVIDTVDHAELPNEFNLTISVDESGIHANIDGNELLTSTEQPPLGTIGLWTADNDGGVSYDNVIVRADSMGQEINFTPEENYHGEASFEYTVSDGKGGVDTGTVSLNIDSVNDAPSITIIGTTITEDTAQVIATANDLDGTIDSSTLSAEHGTVSLDADGNITYTPDANYNGADTVSLSIIDNEGATFTQTVNLTIDPMQDNPVAIDDSSEVTVEIHSAGYQDTHYRDSNRGVTINGEHTGGNSRGITVTLLDEEDALLSSTSFDTYGNSAASAGLVDHLSSVQNSDTGTRIVITTSDEWTRQLSPEAKEALVDIGANAGTLDTAEFRSSFVLVSEQSEQGWEVAHQDYTGVASDNGLTHSLESLTTNEDTALTISAADLLANDTDIDGDTLSIASVAATNDTHGTVSLDDDGNVVFTPEENYHGEASFDYTVSDGNGGTDTASVSLNIEQVNDAPVIVNVDLGSTNEDTAITFTADQLLANSSDSNGDALSISTVTVDTEFGAVTDNGDSTWTFIPADNYNGDDVPVSFTVSDGTTIESATASIDVMAVNDQANFNSDATAISELGNNDASTTHEIAGNVLANNTDVDSGSHFTVLGVNNGISVNQSTNSGALVLDSTGDNPELLGGASSVDMSITVSSTDTGSSTALLSYAVDGQNNEFLVFNSPEGNLNFCIANTFVSSGINASEIYDGNEHTFNVQWDSETGQAKFYLDGEEKRTATIAQGHTLGENGTLMFGQEQDSNGGGFDANQTFEGQYHHVEVSVDGDTKANWDMDSLDDGQVSDNVGNFNLTLIGDAHLSDELLFPLTTDEDNSLVIDVLSNDTDAEGDSLTITTSGAATDADGNVLGTTEIVEVDGKQQISFTPDESLNSMSEGDLQTVSFNYSISDENGGEDQATVTLNVTGSDDNEIYGTWRSETVDGSEKNDQIWGGLGHDTLNGEAGSDTLHGGFGDDSLKGGSGNDALHGGFGADSLSGGTGDDTATGGTGNDSYLFTQGNDTFHGGLGWTDTIQLVANPDDGDTPWKITVDGEQVEYDLAAGALDLQPDTSGVVEMADGSELTFDGVETIQW